MRSRAFRQVDVFTAEPYLGNPVAVVLDGSDLDDDAMAAFARWTNLSETTFVLPPTDDGRAAGADYRLRIFTPTVELPFAGHPTLGSCHAWLEAGGEAAAPERVVQECRAGLVELRREDGRLAFAAPPRLRTGPLEDELLDRVRAGLGLRRDEVRAHAWVDNGPGWCAVLLESAERVLEVTADFGVLGGAKIGVVAGHDVGVVGPRTGDDGIAFELRAFFPHAPGADGVVTSGAEDPVTGSLNASVAQWLREEGLAPASYVAAQGTALRRAGRVHVDDDGERIWVGGDCVTCISGAVEL
ncbi:PhzF family phenazine biosynthesis protein [Patulibacter sp.]|uniref:PhzF family phenazine biosynthesis protein n=1 Tax=Patulibacter sp. TaxID=1912859 RepID=UPI0027194292|nr:PhzF family phenazine biosynthesis protein [Patulibacter sp.]MDO9407161.1 PhzF family phenazine biosynthesis protein [Patulibacter sp.]